MGLNLRNRDRLRPMVWMVARFAMVGVIATAVHAAILALGIERFEVLPPIATVFGFLGGVGVSYVGHYYVTFRSAEPHGRALPAFAGTACGGALLNWMIFVIVTEHFQASYWLAFAIVLVSVPIVVFLVSKAIAFQPDRSGE